eukprot:CAMPEP_0197879518 /NCGR_PEP_ID=MMETSP1439-20131203/7590_1 /TAXON_ID=66791 /ORGANISM="Gonyaulax spinifera, Strain CCMP409" /LENGTH=49 /DNA_ID=CAMNT_0043499027 /DNA_START=75 /DNA_END=225 /DNA_ORIENTATION=+
MTKWARLTEGALCQQADAGGIAARKYCAGGENPFRPPVSSCAGAWRHVS